MNNAVFGRAMENVVKHRDINFVIKKGKELYNIRTGFSNYIIFTEELKAKEMKKKKKKTEIPRNTLVHLGL